MNVDENFTWDYGPCYTCRGNGIIKSVRDFSCFKTGAIQFTDCGDCLGTGRCNNPYDALKVKVDGNGWETS
jgi:DnaJ-class molecular chaperone